MVDEAIDERRRHDVVAENLAPFLEAFVGREHGGRVLVTPRHELKEEHGARAANREIADLVDHEHCRMREHLQARLQSGPRPAPLRAT